MLRIEKLSDPTSITLKLSGRIQEEHLPLLQTEIQACEGVPQLDLADVKLVDRSSVRFLIRWESQGIQLLHCPLYIREWISRERSKRSRTRIQ
jgi:ABC-type transporter Mla MlaB component